MKYIDKLNTRQVNELVNKQEKVKVSHYLSECQPRGMKVKTEKKIKYINNETINK